MIDRFFLSPKTIVLIADFLEPNGNDGMKLTRNLKKQIGEILKDFPNIEVHTLGWPIEDQRGEGSADAHRIGQLAKADIVIWGDYRYTPDFVTYVHFDLLNTSQPTLNTETYRVYGGDQVEQAAVARQQLALP